MAEEEKSEEDPKIKEEEEKCIRWYHVLFGFPICILEMFYKAITGRR